MRNTALSTARAALFCSAVLAGNPPALGAEPCIAATESVAVAAVLDARSIGLQDGRVLRLAGIEPFTLFDPELRNAETALQQRVDAVAGRAAEVRAWLAPGGADRHGRLPALIEADGGLVQVMLAREGLAVAFASGDALPCFERILAAEQAARTALRGFWERRRLPAAHPDALVSRVGRFAIFEGKVESVGNRRARTYLNFGSWWSTDVTVEIESADRDRFGGEQSLAALAGQRVRVRGFVEEKGGPMVTVRSLMQIERLDAPREEALTGAAP